MDTMAKAKESTSNLDDEPDIAVLRSIVHNDEIFHQIMEMFGGTRIYFPKLDRSARDERIRNLYHILMKVDNLTSRQAIDILAQREGLTIRHIYRIININMAS